MCQFKIVWISKICIVVFFLFREKLPRHAKDAFPSRVRCPSDNCLLAPPFLGQNPTAQVTNVFKLTPKLPWYHLEQYTQWLQSSFLVVTEYCSPQLAHFSSDSSSPTLASLSSKGTSLPDSLSVTVLTFCASFLISVSVVLFFLSLRPHFGCFFDCNFNFFTARNSGDVRTEAMFLLSFLAFSVTSAWGTGDICSKIFTGVIISPDSSPGAGCWPISGSKPEEFLL